MSHLTLMGRKKMFILEFTPEIKDKYDLIYECLIGSGQKSLEEDAVTFIDVLRKLRTVGKISEDEQYKRAKIPVYVLDVSKLPLPLEFSKAEFNLLKSTFGKAKFQAWGLELAQETKEWLDGIKESDKPKAE